jgi:hypothetical protein
MIPTKRGLMTPEQIADFLTFRCYSWNRDRGAPATLACVFENGEELERRYQQVKALSYLGYVLRRSGQSADILRREFGNAAIAFEARYQAEIQRVPERQVE